MDTKNTCCFYCKYWGYNNHKPMNTVGRSKCLLRKEKTYSYCFCKYFVPKLIGDKTVC